MFTKEEEKKIMAIINGQTKYNSRLELLEALREKLMSDQSKAYENNTLKSNNHTR